MLMQPLKTISSLVVFICILITTGYSQAPLKTYEKEWKKVDELITKQNLPQSAIAEVKKIYTLAKKEKQEAQVIKALVFITVLQKETREDNEIFSIKEFEKEIETAAQPAKSIMYSLLADLYWSFYTEEFRWKVVNRTLTQQFKKDDISTWDADDFHTKITSLYLASIREEKLLKQTGFKNYNSIITTYGYRYLRPTMYDFLANRALNYFTNDERDLTKPSYVFTINQKEALAPSAEFSRARFITKDNGSLYYRSI